MEHQLPKVKIDGKLYYKDERLKEYRQVTNPQSKISFDEVGERKVEIVEQSKTIKQKRKLE